VIPPVSPIDVGASIALAATACRLLWRWARRVPVSRMDGWLFVVIVVILACLMVQGCAAREVTAPPEPDRHGCDIYLHLTGSRGEAITLHAYSVPCPLPDSLEGWSYK
jgi:hypothetical protein